MKKEARITWYIAHLLSQGVGYTLGDLGLMIKLLELRFKKYWNVRGGRGEPLFSWLLVFYERISIRLIFLASCPASHHTPFPPQPGEGWPTWLMNLGKGTWHEWLILLWLSFWDLHTFKGHHSDLLSLSNGHLNEVDSTLCKESQQF